jgi:UDP-N-acetylglucosamine acyltransferase
MACCHIAHDCDLGSNLIISGGVQLAGHTRIEDHANLSGMSGAVAFSTIGAHAYVGAKTRISRDVPPFMIVEGHDARVRGVNVIGLQRAGVPEQDILALRDAYRRLWRSSRPLAVALGEIARNPCESPFVAQLVKSLQRTEQGLKGRFRETMRADFAAEGARRVAEGREQTV